jgi:hypothetical protein
MPALYDALVAKVRDWSNRDSETLPDVIIQDALRYAADQAYRELRIPALEAVATYNITEAQAGTNSLTIPDDLSEFISLRLLRDSDGDTIGGVGNSITFDAKADYRSFVDDTQLAYQLHRWTRRQNQILVAPDLEAGQTYELYYYRRLPALNARFSVSVANYNANRLTRDLGFGNPDFTTQVLAQPAEGHSLLYFVEDENGDETVYATQSAAEDFIDTLEAGTFTANASSFQGNEAPNWLRDEQEKVLLWGSLYQVFDYLGDDQMSQKYLQKFQGEMQQLNSEEAMRRASGGNVQQNFDGFLI